MRGLHWTWEGSSGGKASLRKPHLSWCWGVVWGWNLAHGNPEWGQWWGTKWAETVWWGWQKDAVYISLGSVFMSGWRGRVYLLAWWHVLFSVLKAQALKALEIHLEYIGWKIDYKIYENQLSWESWTLIIFYPLIPKCYFHPHFHLAQM